MRSPVAWSVVLLCALLAFIVAGPLGGVTVAVLLVASLAPVNRSLLAVNPAMLQYNTDSPAGQTVGFVCQDVTCSVIGGGTAVFVMEGFTCNQFDSEWIVLNNSQGNPNKQKGQQVLPTYETTLQVIGGASPKCPLGFSEVTLLDMGGRSIVWIIAKVSGTGSNDGTATKIPVTLRYKIN